MQSKRRRHREIKMKVYISGAISNNPNYKEEFAAAEKLLKKHGFEVVNPTSLGEVDGWTWEDYMKKDIKLLVDCDAIYLIDGWEKSKGARLEAKLASWLDLKDVCYWDDDDFDIFSFKRTF